MMPATRREAWSEPSAQPFTQRVCVDEVGEGTFAVDLHDRNGLAVGGLELGFPRDVDLLEVLAADLAHDLERPLAERAVRGRVDDDAAQG
jgi:hypothetical protein